MNARVEIPRDDAPPLPPPAFSSGGLFAQIQAINNVALAGVQAGEERARRESAEKIKRLRSALSGLLDLVDSFEDVTYTRDLPEHEAAAIYESEKKFARDVLRETA